MTYPLLGTKIVLDEEKILKENVYNIDKLYTTIDEIAQDCKLIKKNKYTYHCIGNKHDVERLATFIFRKLVKAEWFTKNVKEWVWISEKEGNFDLISESKAMGKGVW